MVVTCRSQQYRDAIRPKDGIEVTLRAAAAPPLGHVPGQRRAVHTLAAARGQKSPDPLEFRGRGRPGTAGDQHLAVGR